MNDFSMFLLCMLGVVSVMLIIVSWGKLRIGKIYAMIDEAIIAMAPATINSFSPLVLDMYKSMKTNPDDWLVTKYHLWHKDPSKNFPVMWIANGVECCRVDLDGLTYNRIRPLEIKDIQFNWFEKTLIYKMYGVIYERNKLGVAKIIRGELGDD